MLIIIIIRLAFIAFANVTTVLHDLDQPLPPPPVAKHD